MQVENDITGTLRKETHGHEPVVAYGLDEEQNGHKEVMGCLKSRMKGGGQEAAVAFTQNQAGDVLTGEVMHNLGTNSNATGRNAANVHTKMQVRRLLPEECEKLQGFPVGHTAIIYKGKPAADGPRYKALGNSMAVNCMVFLGIRIQMVEEVLKEQREKIQSP